MLQAFQDIALPSDRKRRTKKSPTHHNFPNSLDIFLEHHDPIRTSAFGAYHEQDAIVPDPTRLRLWKFIHIIRTWKLALTRNKMRSSLFTTLTLAFLTYLEVDAYAVLDPAKLPSCAFKCQKLVAAQDACIPPAQAVTSQNAYQGCFCSSPQITSLYSTSAGLCDGTCSADDAQKIQKWYTGLCTGSAVVTPSESTPTGSSTSSSAGAASSTSSSSGSAASGESSSQNSSSNSSNSNKSW